MAQIFFKKSLHNIRMHLNKLECVVEIVNATGFQKTLSFCVGVIEDILLLKKVGFETGIER